jgi:hypothetical protein
MLCHPVAQCVLLIRLMSTTTMAFSASSRAAQQQQQEPNPKSSRQFIELNNPTRSAALQQNRLPASFVETWPTWTLEMDGTITKIPDSDGFVPPTSIDVLWQPIDLKTPELRLSVGIHVYVLKDNKISQDCYLFLRFALRLFLFDSALDISLVLDPPPPMICLFTMS